MEFIFFVKNSAPMVKLRFCELKKEVKVVLE